MPDVTKIREPNFSLDLPGEWLQALDNDGVTLVFEEVGGPGKVAVTLLRVRPMFQIADQLRVLNDYVTHRQNFEGGKAAALLQSEPVAEQVGEGFEGEWSSVDPADGRHIKHRVLLEGVLLADFAFEATGVEETEFAERAAAVLESASASA